MLNVELSRARAGESTHNINGELGFELVPPEAMRQDVFNIELMMNWIARVPRLNSTFNIQHSKFSFN
jgi:hypothetical protein